MNNYHFYEEIGKGKHSMVYRCRKKKCVEFCAIKSVDKVSRQKVLNEVMVLNSLHHHNVLKFHTWYETRNHIWLIMEYCTGGDLLNVLLQDTKLPESSICDFGYDLMDGLQFIHSKSVVCCDLKPSNILLDESGTLKFSDFGLSQLLGDIGKNTAEQSKRGTPCYMAPELFRDDGYHSFASDFWALGCVLYEMAAGRPPFVSTSFRDLMDQILNHDFPPIAGSSAEFVELLQHLLNKDRFRRMTWPELLSCPFWSDGERGAPEPMLLPAQPRFDAELEALRRQHQQDDEAAAVAAQLESRKQRGGRGGGGEVDVLRLSRAANSNLAKEVAQAQEGEGEGEGAGYGNDAMEAGAATPEPAAEDVQLAGPDVELNFSDGPGAEEKEEGAAKQAAAGAGAEGGRGSEGGAGTSDRNSEMARVESAVVDGDSEVTAESVAAAEAEAEEEEEEEEIEIEEEETMGPIRVVDRPAASGGDGSSGSGGSGALKLGSGASRPVTAPETGSSAPPPVDTAAGGGAGGAGRGAGSSRAEPQSAAVRPATTATSTRAEQEQEDKARGGGADGTDSRRGGGRGQGSSSAAAGAGSTPPLEKLIYHGSDAGVKPIVNNKRIERIVEPPPYDRNALPFQPRTLQEMLSLAEHDTKELEQFLTAIFRAVGGPVPVAKKVNTLAYFESLCVDTNAANILINSSLMSLFVKMAKAFKSPTLKVRLATSMGLLIRHATYITEQLSEAGLVDVLSTMVQDKHETVRRRSCATLGELLFYVSTQNKQDAGATGSGGVWTVPGNVFGVLVRCLRDVDEIVQHYACKAIENMATAASQEYFVRLCRSDTVSELLAVFNSSSSDGLRSTAISAISRLIKRSPSLSISLVAPLMEKHGVRWMVEGLAESHPKIQQAALTILLQALHAGQPSSRLIKALEGERGLSQTLIKLAEHATVAIRGKALLGALLCSRQIGLKWLARACEAKLLPTLEKVLLRDADNYARQCASCLANGLIELVPTVLAQQAKLLQQPRPGSSSRPGSRGRPASSGGAGAGAGAGSDFTVLHHLTTSPHLLARLGTTQTLSQLGEFLQLVIRLKLGPADKFKSELLLVVEAFTQHAPTLLREWEAVRPPYCAAVHCIYLILLDHLWFAYSTARRLTRVSTFVCRVVLCVGADVLVSGTREPARCPRRRHAILRTAEVFGHHAGLRQRAVSLLAAAYRRGCGATTSRWRRP
jgi:serine/threonine-protein kinase ULK4